MSHLESIKHLVTSLGEEKCKKAQCLSAGRSNLDMVWFGKQYENKEMTCSCCYVLNDEAIKKSLPTQYNIQPLIKFNDKLLEEYRQYEEKKKSATYHPLLIKERKQEITKDLNDFEAKLINSLTSLALALAGFLQKVEAKNKQIYHNQVMTEITELNKEEKLSFEALLEKINLLVQHLNFSETTNNYEFERIEVRNKKLEKEREKINEVINKVHKVLNNLLEDIKKRNESITKI